MKNRLAKKLLILISTAIILAVGLFVLFLIRSANPSSPPLERGVGGFKSLPAASTFSAALNQSLPNEILLSGQETIPLTWTDNNDNETLIIQSDQKYYYGSERAEVYFSVSNTTGQDQSTDIVFWFDGSDKQAVSAEKISNDENSKSEIINSKQIQNSKFKIQNRKDINGYTAGSQFQDSIKAGQTVFYKAVLKYPPQTDTQFFIEAFGKSVPSSFVASAPSEYVAYGHLDPWISSGLVGNWTFNGANTNWTSATAGTTNDLSGNNNTGTMTNMSRSTSPVAGISGQALKFDGVDDYVNIGLSSTLTPTNAITIGAWIKPSALGGAQAVLAKNGPYFFMTNNSNFYVGLYNGSWTWKTGATTLQNNNWYYLALTWTQATSVGTLYVNGVADGTFSIAGPLLENTGNAGSIGSDSPGYDRWYFNGLIDEPRIYNRALSADEVAQNYRAGARRLKANTSLAQKNTSGLVGNWTFNGANTNWTSVTAGATNDLSGNNNTGTLTNMSRSTSPVAGISGQALKFDGVDDYVLVSTTASSPFRQSSAITYSFWVKMPIGGGGHAMGTAVNGGQGSGGVQVTLTGVWFYWTPTAPDSDRNYSTTFSFTANTWYHIAVKISFSDSSSGTIYINGVAQTTTLSASVTNGIPRTSYNNANGDSIGSRYINSRLYFNGLIDEPRIYNRALSAAEVAQNYRAGVRKFSTAAIGSGSQLTGWSYSKQLIIDETKVDADLTDFPVLVKLTSANFNFAKARSDGYDIRFTSSNGKTLLKYERERHDATNQLAEYWVKIPSVSGTVDTDFYIYYGKADATDGADPTNVWDINYKRVYHANDLTSSSIKDSTGTSNLTKGAADNPAEADAKIGKGQNFTSDYVYDSTLGFGGSSTFTAEGWGKGSESLLAVGDSTSQTNMLGWYLAPGTVGSYQFAVVRYAGSWQYLAGTKNTADNNWHYLTATYQSGTNGMKLYVDGAFDAQRTNNESGSQTSNTAINLCQGFNRNNVYPGHTLFWDETRISNIVRSAAWIKASYNSGNDSLVSFGGEEKTRRTRIGR